MKLNRKIYTTALLLTTLSNCSAHSMDTSTTSGLIAARSPLTVQLLDENVTLDKTSVVFTISPRLDPKYKDASGADKVLEKNVEKLYNAKYSGYELKTIANTDGTFTWDNTLNIFLARYSRDVTASWRPAGDTPDHPDFAYQDSRALASDIKDLRPANALDEEYNLVILGSHIRSGFANGAYTFQQALLLFLVDKSSGARATFLYASPTGTQTKALFPLTLKAELPVSSAETYLTNVTSAADTTRGVSTGAPITQVPFHTYISGTFRFDGTTSLEGTAQPFGTPVTALKNNLDFAKFTQILDATVVFDANATDRTLRVISDDDFKTILQALSQGI